MHRTDPRSPEHATLPRHVRIDPRSAAWQALGVVLLALTALTGCDNPACVFGGICAPQSSAGAFGSNPASLPTDGEDLQPAGPILVKAVPTGSTADPRTPIVLFFSESMSSANLGSAFELDLAGTGSTPLQITALVGDGHVVVLFPVTALALGQTYTVMYRTNVTVADRTGQVVVQPSTRLISTFSVPATAPTAPVLLATYPDVNAANRSPTGEIVAFFSRPMDQTTLTPQSFAVSVGGTAVANSPTPQPVSISGVLSDTRVFRWHLTDPMGTAVSLGTSASVHVDFSPATNLIKDSGGVTLPAAQLNYTTLAFSAPTSAEIITDPVDAIGIDSISGPATLMVQVNLADAADGDQVGLYMFGRTPGTTPNLPLIALYRQVAVATPFASVTFDAAQLDLVKSTVPLQARLADGSVTFAFQVKRGSLVSPIKLLDVDAVTAGVQNPVLDTVPPTLIGLGADGFGTDVFTSDQRDIVIVGLASEALRAVSVRTAMGTNNIMAGVPPPVVGAQPSGLFVAAPVHAGVIAAGSPPLEFIVKIYDRALNSSAEVIGHFTQVGQASSGAAPPFTNVVIQVVDALSLVPISGAEVSVHENLRGAVSFVGSGTTDVAGNVTLPPALLGETIVSVRAAGHELFTFDGLPSDHVCIPLAPLGVATSNVQGLLSTTDPTLNLYSRSVNDTRLPSPGETLSTVNSCQFDGLTQHFECLFGPLPVAAETMGAESAIAVLPPPSPFLYSALTFLKAFSLDLPLAPIAPGLAQTNTLSIPVLLDSATLDAEARPIDVPAQLLSTVFWPTISGTPLVRVEAVSPGFGRTLTVGEGIGFNDMLPAHTYAVRAAYPGVADGIQDSPTDLLGSLVVNGTIQADLLLRAEVVDADMNRGGVRPRFSHLPTAPTPNVVPAPPLLSPTPITLDPGGLALDVAFADVFPDSLGLPGGLYRVTVVDGVGVPWTIWRLDQPDASGPDAVVHLPFIGPGGTFPLAAGNVSVRVSAYAWMSFDPQSFLWSDVEREYELFSHLAATQVTPP